jgi:hypothetical protein
MYKATMYFLRGDLESGQGYWKILQAGTELLAGTQLQAGAEMYRTAHPRS